MLKLRMPTRMLLSSLPCLAALGLMTPTAPTLAQQYEWEADEGVHEEEWYDPTDWFNDDDSNSSTINYESSDWNDSYDWSYDYDYDWGYDTYDTYAATYDSVYDYDAYYDGYYDGYYDDTYGFDYWDNTWDTTYSSTFTDGYYDGYYDQTQDYLYEPYYYIGTNQSTDRSRNTSQQRANDQSRDRGDRATSQSQNQQQAMNRSQGQNRAQQQKQQHQRTEMVRRRGTVQSMTQKNPAQISDKHTVLQVEFDDGDQMLADFGPKMTRQRLPFSQGDRVTLRGNRVQRDGKAVLMVQRISSGDQQINLRPSSSQGSQNDAARGQQNRRNQSNDRRKQVNASPSRSSNSSMNNR